MVCIGNVGNGLSDDGVGVMIKPLLMIIGVYVVWMLGIIYPYMPGAHDPLAIPMSTVLQVGVLVSLLWVPIGIVWVIVVWQQRAMLWVVRVVRIMAVVSSGVLAVIGYASGGIFFGMMVAVVVGVCLRWVWRQESFVAYGAVYLVAVPVCAMATLMGVSTPVTDRSRAHAIAQSQAMIDDLADYYARNQRYPVSLQAMYHDYPVGVVGVARYYYVPSATAYNLMFEQPRFLLDDIGTREWVVYNPRDEHRVYSHDSWILLLSATQLSQSQGWYANEPTAYPHWRTFLFD
jgi:hypothetical protein